MLGILGEGDRTHCSRPADIHQIEVLLLLLSYTTTTTILLKTNSYCIFFQYFGIFSDRKNIPAPARGLSSLPVQDSLAIQSLESRRLAA